MDLGRGWPWKAPLLSGAVCGGVYGAFFRLYAQLPILQHPRAASVMTLGFLGLGPFAIGYLTVAVGRAEQPRRVGQCLVAPWLGVFLSAAIAYLLNLEGLICVAFLLPLGMVVASLGGLCAWTVDRVMQRRYRAMPMACVAILPMLVAPMEARWVRAPLEHRMVATEIRIHAPAAVVWSNIERVRPIDPSELRPAWTDALGFPRPIEATLSQEGVGGVRHASFEHGLLFIETVTDWEPDQRLAFSIRADTAAIPRTTLDEHVTIGGAYFDVLDGEYRIEPVGNGDVVLHLESEERLSTDFNGYAGMWSDAVMRSLQGSILEVIRKRCEGSKFQVSGFRFQVSGFRF